MKKSIALAIISIFMFSLVPIAFADDDEEIRVDARVSASASGSGSSNNNSGTRHQKDKAEDVRNTKEDIRNISNIGRQRCMEKCRNESNEDCEARCRIADKGEDKRDRKEDHRGRVEDIKNNHPNLSASEIAKLNALGAARIKELAKLDEERIKMQLKMIKVVRIKNFEELNKRNISDSMREDIKEEFENAKERIERAKEELEDARERLNDAKRNQDDEAVLNISKQYLLKASDALISHLEKIKAKIQENENIEAEASVQIIAEIDAQISDINHIKEEINAATTKDEIKQIAKKLRSKWNRLQHFMRLYSYRVVSARVEGLVNQGKLLEKRLEKILEAAESRNISVDVSAEVEAFSGHISSAKDYYAQAQAKIAEAIALKATNSTSADKIKQLADEAKDLLDKSRNEVKSAHDVLKDIVRKIKNSMPDADLSEEIEVEVEVEHESEIST